MKIFRLIKHDLQYGTAKQIMTFLFLIAIVLVCINGAYEYFHALHGYNMIAGYGNFFDYLLYLFQGDIIHEISLDSRFSIPVYWLGIHLFIALSVGSYPCEDLTGYGRMKILYSGSRLRWLAGKLIWIILHVLTCYMIMYMTVFLFCITKQADISFTLSADIWENTRSEILSLKQSQILEMIIILPLLTSIAISFFQNLLAVIFQPQIGYIFTCCLLILSCYWVSPITLGNYTMWYRNVLIDSNGVESFTGCILNITIIILVFIVLWQYMKKCDILDKKERL